MSAFLGPIHFWLYNKIRFQEGLSDRILSHAKEQSWKNAGIIAGKYEISELKPLEELIDLRNIHGWLQSRIQEAESRYANIVTEILADNPSVLPELEQVAYDFGADNPVEEKDVASDVYRKFDDTLLNGMPCDRVNVITSQDNDLYTWEQAEDIHGSYWRAAAGNPEVYYRLRLKVMEGMLKNSRISIGASDFNHYSLATS